MQGCFIRLVTVYCCYYISGVNETYTIHKSVTGITRSGLKRSYLPRGYKFLSKPKKWNRPFNGVWWTLFQRPISFLNTHTCTHIYAIYTSSGIKRNWYTFFIKKKKCICTNSVYKDIKNKPNSKGWKLMCGEKIWETIIK